MSRAHHTEYTTAMTSLVYLASPERSAELVVVHVRFALSLPPQPGQPLRVPDDELAPFASPADGPALAAAQQLQQEVPQLHLPGARRPGGLVGPVREQHSWRDQREKDVIGDTAQFESISR